MILHGHIQLHGFVLDPEALVGRTVTIGELVGDVGLSGDCLFRVAVAVGAPAESALPGQLPGKESSS